MANQYRKKPVVIEAMQYERVRGVGRENGTNLLEIATWTGGEWDRSAVGDAPFFSFVKRNGDRLIGIRTLEGTMHADIGDWIIKGVKGEFYPCKPDIFEATYELVDSGEPSEGAS